VENQGNFLEADGGHPIVKTNALRRAGVRAMEVPMPSAKPTVRRTALNLRIKPDDRGLIDGAARLTGKTGKSNLASSPETISDSHPSCPRAHVQQATSSTGHDWHQGGNYRGSLGGTQREPFVPSAVQRSPLTFRMDGASCPATRARQSSATFGACSVTGPFASFAVKSLP
jgi:hypothetical protein